MLNGYWEKLFFIDLSAGMIRNQNQPEAVNCALLEGYGLAAHYLYKNIPPRLTRLGWKNLAFMPDLLTGSKAQFGWQQIPLRIRISCSGDARTGCPGHYYCPDGPAQ